MGDDRALVRSAAWLFVLAGMVTLVSSWFPHTSIASSNALDATALTAIAIGITAWLVPWERWHPRSSLVLVPPALALVALGSAYGNRSPYAYGTYFVVIFTWVGLCHPRWTPLRLAPLAVPFYLLPVLLKGGGGPGAVSSVAITVPVAVLVGETVAWAVSTTREASRAADHRTLLLRTVARSTTTMTALDPQAVLAAVVESALELEMDGAWLATFSSDGSSWQVTHALGACADLLGSAQPSDAGLPGLVRSQRAAVIVPDRRSTVATPVWAWGILPAVLMACSDHRTLSEEDAEALMLLANHAGRTLENANRFGEERRARKLLAEVSVRDELTGVGNRRHAVALLQSLSPGDAVVMIDLDHFKRVNDTEGHEAGDKVLLALADHLSHSVRDADTVARYGGEEFLVVLRGAWSGGMEIAQRLCASWRSGRPATTFSAGVAVHRVGQSPHATVAEADAALYAAKRTGRDRVCESTELSSGR